jgi:hypothetical protein
MWEPRRLATLWASTACYRDSFTILPKYHKHYPHTSKEVTRNGSFSFYFSLFCSSFVLCILRFSFPLFILFIFLILLFFLPPLLCGTFFLISFFHPSFHFCLSPFHLFNFHESFTLTTPAEANTEQTKQGKQIRGIDEVIGDVSSSCLYNDALLLLLAGQNVTTSDCFTFPSRPSLNVSLPSPPATAQSRARNVTSLSCFASCAFSDQDFSL